MTEDTYTKYPFVVYKQRNKEYPVTLVNGNVIYPDLIEYDPTGEIKNGYTRMNSIGQTSDEFRGPVELLKRKSWRGILYGDMALQKWKGKTRDFYFGEIKYKYGVIDWSHSDKKEGQMFKIPTPTITTIGKQLHL